MNTNIEVQSDLELKEKLGKRTSTLEVAKKGEDRKELKFSWRVCALKYLFYTLRQMDMRKNR